MEGQGQDSGEDIFFLWVVCKVIFVFFIDFTLLSLLNFVCNYGSDQFSASQFHLG